MTYYIAEQLIMADVLSSDHLKKIMSYRFKYMFKHEKKNRLINEPWVNSTKFKIFHVMKYSRKYVFKYNYLFLRVLISVWYWCVTLFVFVEIETGKYKNK